MSNYKAVKVLVAVEVEIDKRTGKVQSITLPEVNRCQKAYDNGASWTVHDETRPTIRPTGN